MTDPRPFPGDREETSRRTLGGDGGGNGSRYDRLLAHIHRVETTVAKIDTRLEGTATEADVARIDTRLESTATKADLKELQSSMLKWFIATLIAAIAAVAAVVAVLQ